MQEGNQYQILEEQLSSKIWYLIELALKSTYLKVWGNKCSLNSKYFIESKEAKYFKDRETINENLDLK